MGLLSWLFGTKKDAKSEWNRSEKGNLTRHIEGDGWLTVFPQDGGWKFVAPYPDEVKDDFEGPYFSPPFETERAARECADAYMLDQRWPHEDLWTKRDKERPAQNKTMLPSLIAKERTKLDELVSALERQEKLAKRKESTVVNLHARIVKRMGTATHLRNQASDSRLQASVSDANTILAEYPAIIERAKALLPKS